MNICYIATPQGITAVYMNEQIYYLRRDQQGSITGLIGQDSTIIEEYSYDAWGRRRNPADWTYDNVPTPQYLYRGHTFHEHMDEFCLINMNGRAYDPIVGRFLNADPVIQNTSNTQNYNRYSYCLNNPLKYTDPSGYRWSQTQQSRYNNELRMLSQMSIMERERNDMLKLWMTGSNVHLVGVAAHGGPKANNADGNQALVGAINFSDFVKIICKYCPVMKLMLGNSVTDTDCGLTAEEETQLSSPRDFAEELKYYFKYNSNTGYKLSAERFADIYKQAHDKNAIEWNKAVKGENGTYKIPVDFYKTDYDLAFGRATMIFNFNSKTGFEVFGFYDYWDLDAKPIGERSFPAEIITRYYNWSLGSGSNFSITYP